MNIKSDIAKYNSALPTSQTPSNKEEVERVSASKIYKLRIRISRETMKITYLEIFSMLMKGVWKLNIIKDYFSGQNCMKTFLNTAFEILEETKPQEFHSKLMHKYEFLWIIISLNIFSKFIVVFLLKEMNLKTILLNSFCNVLSSIKALRSTLDLNITFSLSLPCLLT